MRILCLGGYYIVLASDQETVLPGGPYLTWESAKSDYPAAR